MPYINAKPITITKTITAAHEQFLVGQLIQGMIRTYRDNIHKFIVYIQLHNITVKFS